MKNGSRASDRAPLRCLERGKKISVSTPEPEPRVRERERNARISNGCKKFLRNFGKLCIAKMRKVRKSVKEGKKKERERENEAENKYSRSRDLRMFRATCGKKGKVDFWVMRACEAITRVVEEAGYWSLRDTRDKTGEGRKK